MKILFKKKSYSSINSVFRKVYQGLSLIDEGFLNYKEIDTNLLDHLSRIDVK